MRKSTVNLPPKGLSLEVLDSPWTRKKIYFNKRGIEEESKDESEYNSQTYESDSSNKFKSPVNSKFIDTSKSSVETKYSNESSDNSQCLDKLDGLQEELQAARKASSALKKDLKIIKEAEAQQEKALEWMRKEKNTLAKVLNDEQAKTRTLRVENELMKAQVVVIQKSQKEQQHRYEKLQKKMTAIHKEEQAVIKNMTDENLKKDNEIQSLQFITQNFKTFIEAKDRTISWLQKMNYDAAVSQQKLNPLIHENQQLVFENQRLRAHGDAVSQQQKFANEHDLLTKENLQLISKIKRLKGDLEDALNEKQCAQKQHQEDKEACSRLEKEVQMEKAHFFRASEEIEMLKKANADTMKDTETKYELEEALRQEKELCAALQKRTDQSNSVLEKVKATSEQHLAELWESKEQQQLTESLEKAQSSLGCLQAQHQAEFRFQESQIKDKDSRFKEQKLSLGNALNALTQLQNEYIDLGKRYGQINSLYRRLLKEHGDLQNRHERLAYAKGNPRAELSVSHLCSATEVKHEWWFDSLHQQDSLPSNWF